MSRKKTHRIIVSPGGGKGKGEATPVELSRSPIRGECLRIRVDSHFDQGQTATMAYMLLSLLPPAHALQVLGEVTKIPAVEAFMKARFAEGPPQPGLFEEDE